MRHTIEIDDLAAVLAPEPTGVIALVGGGGKTTALFALGARLGGRVVLTTTTKMGADRLDGHDPLLDPSDAELTAALARTRVVLVWRGIDDHRALGVAAEVVDRWASLADHVVVEADGSRRRPFKAPAPHEPVVPSATTRLVGCVGSSAFDGVIAEVCHRPDEVARLAGCEPGDRLTAGRLAAVLGHPEGTGKGRPAGAGFTVLLNRVETRHEGYVDELEDALSGADVDAIVRVAPIGPAGPPTVRPAGR